MVILQKPGRPDYSVTKAYRPIVLLNMTVKLLSEIVAEQTTHMLETNNLLPATHFGGRPGCSTQDSLLLLETTIKHVWRQHKVISTLFLDIEGAFPNAITDQLLHNMRKCHLPLEIVKYMEHLLKDRKTKLHFDDFKSEWSPITNGIGQGDPLSMILYVIYNSDLVDIAKKEKGELTLAFVDDTALIAVGNSFEETHQKLMDMLERCGGGYKWSNHHNSRFETNKFALMDFTLNRTRHCPSMTLHGVVIKSTATHKFLGVMLDNELWWKAHTTYAVAKGAAYTMLLKCLLSVSWGTPAKLMHQLHIPIGSGTEDHLHSGSLVTTLPRIHIRGENKGLKRDRKENQISAKDSGIGNNRSNENNSDRHTQCPCQPTPSPPNDTTSTIQIITTPLGHIVQSQTLAKVVHPTCTFACKEGTSRHQPMYAKLVQA